MDESSVPGHPVGPASSAKLNTHEPGAPPRLREILERLEQIRRELDREDLDLEDQVVLYREGCTLAAQAKGILDTTRAQVEFLMEGTEVQEEHRA
jgi:exodeoxyribonuclease VII small subunit